MTKTKRFIAGAVCPRCNKMDTIRTYKEGDASIRECVDCGFEDELRIQPQVKELETRVNVSEKQVEVETQVVKLQGLATKSPENPFAEIVINEDDSKQD